MDKLTDATFTYHHLSEMKEQGSSVSLSWGEDTGEWECSWVTGGERYTGTALTIVGAVFNARATAERAAGTVFIARYR